MLSPELLKILCCPKCHGKLKYVADNLTCISCARVYPIRDDIPIMLVDESPSSPSSDE
ncbi:MAG TPA: Trm112 family protein [Bacteroidota bacterium]|jgi:uncharacterized protein YbaR (Trm112 family)|nr:Trm112 family protein [Bacteroidota bacterium]